MKPLLEVLTEANMAIEAIGLSLVEGDLICVSCYGSFTTVHLSESGVAKATALFGEPVTKPTGSRQWNYPGFVRESWMSDWDADFWCGRWPGNVEITSRAKEVDPVLAAVVAEAENDIGPVTASGPVDREITNTRL